MMNSALRIHIISSVEPGRLDGNEMICWYLLTNYKLGDYDNKAIYLSFVHNLMFNKRRSDANKIIHWYLLTELGNDNDRDWFWHIQGHDPE